MNEEYLKEYPDILRNVVLIYQNEVTIKKIIFMVSTDYLMKIYIIKLLKQNLLLMVTMYYMKVMVMKLDLYLY